MIDTEAGADYSSSESLKTQNVYVLCGLSGSMRVVALAHDLLLDLPKNIRQQLEFTV